MNGRQGTGSRLGLRCRWRVGIKRKVLPLWVGDSDSGRLSRQTGDYAVNEEPLGLERSWSSDESFRSGCPSSVCCAGLLDRSSYTGVELRNS